MAELRLLRVSIDRSLERERERERERRERELSRECKKQVGSKRHGRKRASLRVKLERSSGDRRDR
jgi:hypothetical protein